MTTAGRSGPALCRAPRALRTTMLRFALAADGSVVPDIRCRLPGRGVWTRLSSEAVRRAADKRAFSRAFRAKADAPADVGGDRRRVARARRASVAVDGQQGRTRRRGRVQGRFGDRERRGGRAHSSERRGIRRRAKAGPGSAGAIWRDRRSDPVDLSLLVEPIGFGIGEGKCDTCCAEIRRGDFCLSSKGGSFAPLSRERSGRDP